MSKEVGDMAWEPIRKRYLPGSGPNLADYDRAVREFSWDAARAQLDGLPGDEASTSRTRQSTGMRQAAVRQWMPCAA